MSRRKKRPKKQPTKLSAITIRSSARSEASGYARAARQLSQSLQQLGVEITDDADTVLHVGDANAWKPAAGKRNIGFGWWPFSRVPDTFLQGLYGIDQLIVPSAWCAEGVVMPRPDQTVHVVQLGVDASVFSKSERQRSATLRLLHFDSNVADYRAGADLALHAFKEVFRDRDDVALDILTTQQVQIDKNDARVQILRNIGSDESLADLYRSHDALIFSSRGEGAGLVALEAMSTGLPVMHSGQTAMTDFADVGTLVGSRKMRVPVTLHPLAECYEPWPDLLTIRLRQLDENYDEWQAKAQADADIVQDRWTWERSARRLIDVLEGRDPVVPAAQEIAA